jgi:cyclopropane fatty-acyl-phospholipid synthase-like methyltransferase
MKESLDEGEILMLQDYCEKAKVEDGLEILDLGCGWGSLSLFLAQVLIPLLLLPRFFG